MTVPQRPRSDGNPFSGVDAMGDDLHCAGLFAIWAGMPSAFRRVLQEALLCPELRIEEGFFYS